MQIFRHGKLSFCKKPALNAGTTDKVPRMKLREKNEEAAMISPENERYKKSEARGASRMKEFDEIAPKSGQPRAGNQIAL